MKIKTTSRAEQSHTQVSKQQNHCVKIFQLGKKIFWSEMLRQKIVVLKMIFGQNICVLKRNLLNKFVFLPFQAI